MSRFSRVPSDEGALARYRSWIGVLVFLLGMTAMAMGRMPGVGKAAEVFSGRLLQLGLAVEARDAAAITRSIGSGVDPNGAGRDGITPLWFAALNGHLASIRPLVRGGADPAAIHSELGSVLGYAAQIENPALLVALLDAGVSPNIFHPDEDPLIFATMMSSRWENMKLLLDRRADINIASSVGVTPLRLAINTLDFEVAEYLVRRGADVNTRLTNGDSATASLERSLKRYKPGSETHTAIVRLMRLMAEKGAKFSIDPGRL